MSLNCKRKTQVCGYRFTGGGIDIVIGRGRSEYLTRMRFHQQQVALFTWRTPMLLLLQCDFMSVHAAVYT